MSKPIQLIGKVAGIAIKTSEGGPMRELAEAVVEVDGGLAGDVKSRPDRGVTLLSAQQWRQVCAELKTELPWHTRRANLLIDAGGLGELIGRRIRIGPVLIQVKGETAPCGIMDQAHKGLRFTLENHYRGGVHGRVLEGGLIRIGAEVVAVE